jgi:signal transduction histidine kinase/ActR/RegA family two-component response regulator
MIRRLFYRLTIRGKLVTVVMVVSAAVLVLCIASFVAWDYFQFRQDARRELSTQARMVLENSTAAMSFQDQSAAQETLETLAPNPHIRVACLYDPTGVRFAEFRVTGESASCPENRPTLSSSFGPNRLEVVEQAQTAGRPAGSVYLRSDLDVLRGRLRAQVGMAASLLLLALGTAFVLSEVLQRTISEPIHRLADTARQVTERRDYSLRVEKTTADELGALVEVFNGMLDEIQRSEEERASLLRREREANRLKDEFLMTLSHELRTPLNAILGWTRMLTTGVIRPEDTAKALQKVERNAQMQARLVEDLLEVSRLATGKIQLQTAPLDLAVVVSHAIEAVRAQADAKHITIETRFAHTSLPTTGDAARLQQVVWNLLTNALKFSGDGSRIVVSLRRGEGADYLDVEDYGAGIEEAFLPYVFEPFRQGDASTTREHGGLGLGLSIARRFTELHGGQVAARSAGRGHGATFSITLPVACDDIHQPVSATPPANTPAPSLSNVTVLIVDDDLDSRDMLVALLDAAGAIVRSASSVVEAMTLVGPSLPDVLVTDIAMPGADGYDLIRRLRGRFGGTGPMVTIALTAQASGDDRDRALAAGFERHVGKPFDPTALVQVIEDLLRRAKDRATVGQAPEP